MKKVLAALITVAAVTTAGTALAGNTATEDINLNISTIREFDVPTGALTMTISTATPGLNPDDALNSAAYNITTNVNSKIMAKIDSAMPANTTLKVLMGSVGGGVPSIVTLSAIDQDAQTGIGPVAATGNTLDYTFSATALAAPVATTRTVTYTLTAP